RLDLFALGALTFERPDMDTFRGLALAYSAMRKGGSAPAMYNAANECAVELFLNKGIAYLEIAEVIEAAMDCGRWVEDPDLEDILATEREIYEFVESRWGN
ncbi:MAG: 1-deoxy-D-xylulose-5-phosphate reductoisomerase, partial [Agathobacter sp.]|nr:1-deoxy-D-xylulose-5-phosphate reductoisomerase [Agathobacter sp.]